MDAYGLEGIRPYLGEVAAETYLALGHPDARAIAEINCALAEARGRTRERSKARWPRATRSRCGRSDASSASCRSKSLRPAKRLTEHGFVIHNQNFFG